MHDVYISRLPDAMDKVDKKLIRDNVQLERMSPIRKVMDKAFYLFVFVNTCGILYFVVEKLIK